MSSRVLVRFLSRRLLSSSKISSVAVSVERICIKKMEKENLEKLARKGPNPEEKTLTGSRDSGSVCEAEVTGLTSNSALSTDKNQNCVVLAGGLVVLGALGWYLQSKKPEEVLAYRERGMLEPHSIGEMPLHVYY